MMQKGEFLFLSIASIASKGPQHTHTSNSEYHCFKGMLPHQSKTTEESILHDYKTFFPMTESIKAGDVKVHHPEKVHLGNLSDLSWNKFAQSTTIHGIKHVFDDSSKSKLRKFVKFVECLSFSQIYTQILNEKKVKL